MHEEKTPNQIHATVGNLVMFAFSNPPRSNLCFSNAVISMFLNIPILQIILTSNITSTSSNVKNNEIFEELKSLCRNSQFSSQSTQKIRTLVKKKCFKAGQTTRNFNNKLQHDAGEFMGSMMEHLFKETTMPLDIDEKVFGGLFQETIICKCGEMKLLPIQKLSEIWTIQVDGDNMQSCIENFLGSEIVDLKCERCSYPKKEKQIKLIIEPKTLIIQLKRYEFDQIQQKIKKKTTSVVCPTLITLPGGSTYSLTSVLHHIGSSPDNGHYTVTLYDKENKSFFLLDDSVIDENVIITEEMWRLSYMACYTKE